MEVIFLFFLGLVLLVVEAFFLPGFRLCRDFRLDCDGGSIILSYASSGQGVAALAIALTWSFFLVSLVFQYLKSSSFMSRIVLKTAAEKEKGYSAVPTYEQYLGQVGVVVHQLRPSGVIEMADGNGWMWSRKGPLSRRGKRLK